MPLPKTFSGTKLFYNVSFLSNSFGKSYRKKRTLLHVLIFFFFFMVIYYIPLSLGQIEYSHVAPGQGQITLVDKKKAYNIAIISMEFPQIYFKLLRNY